MNNNNINFKVHRTKEGTIIEAICGLLILLSVIFSFVVMSGSKQGGAAMLIQTGIITFVIVVMLMLAYAPHTFNIPDNSPAELFIATVRFIRLAAVLIVLLSLGITLSALFGANPAILPTLFGCCFVPLMCWYFYVYFKVRRKRSLMKRILVTSTLAVMQLTAPAQNISGTWNGELNAGIQKIPVVLNLTADGKCTLDSPQQGAKGIPAGITFISADSLSISLKALNASYAAKLQDGELKGIFTQNGFKLPLSMKPGGVEPAKRPQTPKPPYPYTTEEVTFANPEAGATLAGTLVVPKDAKTVLLMVTGSGQQNRDEEVFEHKPFAVIADYLARQGIATLRYDDRATGASVGGEVKNATTLDFMGDAAAGLDFLRNRKEFNKVGVLGHSEGGTIALMLGARKKADFIISLAGPGVKGDTLLATQANRIMALHGVPETMTVEKYRQQESVQAVPWIKWFMDYDPTDDIRQTHCPVMAINGDRDCQVISSQNLTAIQELLPPSKKNFIKEYPGLNHLFQHCQTGLPTEYGVIEETISPEVLHNIATWIHEP